MTARGRFITLEGGEGAGKTTLSRGLATILEQAGHTVLRTREPGGSPGAEAIRELVLGRGGWDPLAEAMLMSAARREHLRKTIEPALDGGRWVISDRFADSTMAYQGDAEGVGAERCRLLTSLALGQVRPDLTLILDLPVELGAARARQRGETNRFEDKPLGFHERVRQAFLRIAADEPGRCTVIDASRPVEEVLEQARVALDRLLQAS
ncbi:dTMP kinase [Roseomonas elaeocarpi]|uniref:Thymidylate kinase n=1 Tax=Roseomonas elaeocarpi TaxID=907779 RepID=A0ABV6JXZ0_9PROT